LCTYTSEDRPEIGVVVDESVYDIGDAAAAVGTPIPTTATGDPMRSLLEDETAWSQLAADFKGFDPAAKGLTPKGTLDTLSLLPPVVRPDKVICIGLNYRSHAEEAGMELTPVPTFFVKLPNAFRGHGDAIVIPRVSHRIDWEGELGVVIGRRCHDVTAAEAGDYIAGLTVVNDVTARDYQFKTSQWILGKTFDSFSPMGPVIATPDEVGPLDAVHLETVVSGTTFQSAVTDDMVFPIPALIEFLSSIMTLEPGDIIATGTPSGIGALQKPSRWLVDGDTVSVTIEGVGTLSNTVVGRPRDQG
jgi:2-keto-4-pentenoate hydratase/2-oxohepta-3-ene-1,7-dioic acid hydratase in catechol pathway